MEADDCFVAVEALKLIEDIFASVFVLCVVGMKLGDSEKGE